MLQCWGSEGIEMSEACSSHGRDDISYKICVGEVKLKRLLEIFGRRLDNNMNRKRICELFWIILGLS
jgi:hypothetical protein